MHTISIKMSKTDTNNNLHISIWNNIQLLVHLISKPFLIPLAWWFTGDGTSNSKLTKPRNVSLTLYGNNPKVSTIRLRIYSTKPTQHETLCKLITEKWSMMYWQSTCNYPQTTTESYSWATNVTKKNHKDQPVSRIISI